MAVYVPLPLTDGIRGRQGRDKNGLQIVDWSAVELIETIGDDDCLIGGGIFLPIVVRHDASVWLVQFKDRIGQEPRDR